MTQLDLPQISLSRYVDLLKRRRWQVIPVSVIGLLVGGIVAFFIPRYYVTEARISYRQPPAEDARNVQDPFGAIIDNAKQSIPLAIEATIGKDGLGWPEGAAADPFEVSENVRAIRGRLEIEEEGDSKNRSFALLHLTYKDRDGKRAADFLNKLMVTWRDAELRKLKDQIEQNLARASERQRELQRASRDLDIDSSSLMLEYQIEPNSDAVQMRSMSQELARAQAELVAQLAVRKAEVQGLVARVQDKRHEREAMSLKVPPTLDAPDLATNQQAKYYTAQIAQLNLERASLQKGLPRIREIDEQIKSYTQSLAELLKPVGADPEGMVPNPKREVASKELAKLESDLQAKQAEFDSLERDVEAQGKELARRIEGFKRWSQVQQALEAAKKDLGSATDEVNVAQRYRNKLTSEPTVQIENRAQLPSRPTDPNIALVALLGCVLGLLVATGLVLVLDLLQASYKTVDDVERGLAVPVLGGVSYLETEAQRQQAVRSRRRATLVAAALLMLVGGVVLVYYYDPTRLPPFVCDLLSMVLGTA